jgi:Porin subfamily
MKMVKSLLLGSAAGLVAVSAGQAADLPVKAKPIEYVKVCSLYGAGFYYMPGTDICLKIGGYARAETTYHSNGNFSAGPTGGDVNNRTTNEFVMRARAYITADAREQTAWGTARAYVAVGVATTDVGNSLTPSILGFNRAFIQWAGITAGITQSFYDFMSYAAVNYRAYWPNGDTGDAGWWVWAYTAQIGNGVSATISAEQRRMTQIVGFVDGISAATNLPTFTNAPLGAASLVAGTNTTDLGYGGIQVPDIVGNIRVDQTWGSAQVMGVAHEVNAAYYGPSTLSNGLSETGHPGDKWGWVAGVGLRLNAPFIAQGDYFQAQAAYTQGALRYMNQGNGTPNFGWERGNNFGFGVLSDCVFGSTAAPVGGPVVNGTGCNLTTGWQVNASYEHYWTPQFHESFYGGIEEVRYNAQANALLCTGEGAGTFLGETLLTGSLARAAPGCNNNFDIWTAGTRLQYDFTKTLYVGVDFLYSHLDTAKLPGNELTNANTVALLPPLNDLACATAVKGVPTATGAAPCGTIKDMNNLAVTLRIHKDFLP